MVNLTSSLLLLLFFAMTKIREGYAYIHINNVWVKVTADIVSFMSEQLSHFFPRDPSRRNVGLKETPAPPLHISASRVFLRIFPLSCPPLWFPVGGVWRNLIDPVNILCLPPPMGSGAGMRRVVAPAKGLCCKSKAAAVTHIHIKLVIPQRLRRFIHSFIYVFSTGKGGYWKYSDYLGRDH